MADHGTITHSTTTTPVSADMLFDDRQRMWGSFMNATLGMIIFVIALLVGMAVFLL